MRYLIIIFLCLSVVIIPSLRSQGESFTHLTIKDGLSQSSVKCLYQDYKGFIWAGTADGLNKFDGSRFMVYRYNPLAPKTISGNDISCIYESPYDSTLYIGTQDAGLVIYNRAKNNFISIGLKQRNVQPDIPLHIKDIIAVNDSTLLIGTNQNGLYIFYPNDSSLVEVEFSNPEYFQQINCLETDNQNNLWMGTPAGLFLLGLNELKSNQNPERIIYHSSGSAGVNALNKDIRGNLWIGTSNKGLYKYQPITKESENFSINFKAKVSNEYVVNVIIQTMDGNIWAGTNKGLLKYLENINEFKIFQYNNNNPESINNNNIYSLFEDQSGILWIGTFTGGINKLDPLKYRFEKYTEFSVLPPQQKANIHSVHVDHLNRIWMGTPNGLLEMRRNTLDSGSSDYRYYLHLKDQYIGAIASTTNDLLISSNGILLMNNDGRGPATNLSELIKEQTGEQVNGFFSSFTGRKGNVWFTTAGGLLKYSPDEKRFWFFYPKDSNGNKTPVNFSSITEDYSGRLWLGTYKRQLFTFDVFSEEFELFVPHENYKELLIFDKIFSICEPSPGNIFIGTDMGLYSIVPKEHKVTRYLHAHGLPNNTVYAVIPDQQGRIWCSTNAGISCLTPNTNKFQSYTYEDGLQSNEFNEGAYFKDNDGHIYMGGIEGLNIFDPYNIRRNNYIPPVVITNMEIRYEKVTLQEFPQLIDNQISETKKITLGHNENTFSFDFSALSYSLYHRNQYQFTLTRQGEEDNWINAQNRRTASYTNISPGHYFFKVKGSNSDGIWNETPASIELFIIPPYWQKWWFRSTLLLFLLGMPFLVVFLRIRNIKRQRFNLQKLVRNKTAQIEIQNQKLLETNSNIRQKNKQLYSQHQQIVEQRNSLMEMAEKAEAANQTKINLFTNISHEMRTPLTLIVSPLKDLISKLEVTDKNEIKRKLTNIHTSASKMLAIVNQLLEFRKAESGNMQLVVSKIDLIQFTQKTASLFNDLAQQKKFSFIFSSSYNKLNIWADPDKLEKILFNLILNAFNFTSEEGTVHLKVSTLKSEGNIYAAIVLKDTGTGIHKSKLPHIFKQFYQADHQGTPGQPGSGLGLAITSKFIEMHNGKITVTSSVGKGSEFMILLPFGRKHFDKNVIFNTHLLSDTETLKTTISDYIPFSNREFPTFDFKEKHTILIIEDDENLRSYLKEFFANKYDFIEAANAKQGLKLLNSKHTNLVICDVFLPDRDGMEVCKKIKSDEKTCHLPLIMLTSAADQENKTKGIKSGADYYITKPFDLEYLAVTIETILENRAKIRKKYSLKNAKNEPTLAITAKDQRFLNEVVECIEKNLTNSSFNVDSLCSHIGISQSNCYRKIKSLTGFNISEFIRNTRLKKASELLEQKNYKINEVAYETGFNDPNYFTKSFTRFYGITPSEYANL